jgi:hypothetical protein
MIYADTHKFVAIVNKNLEPGVALNALAHSAAGLAASASKELREKMSFINFPDKNGNEHPSISALSLIVLRGTSNEIRKARNKYVEEGIHFVDFLETMTGNTYKEQLEKTADSAYEELNFYGIIAFGEKKVLEPITKRLSLWR